MNGWQPIETAPANTMLLVWGPLGFSIAEYEPASNDQRWWYAYANGELATDDDAVIRPTPTHWTPLPQSPDVGNKR